MKSGRCEQEVGNKEQGVERRQEAGFDMNAQPNGVRSQEQETDRSNSEFEIPNSELLNTQRSEAVDPNISRPTPPFWGTQILNPADIPLEEVFWYLDLQALFVGQWQFRKPQDQSREAYEAFLAETVHPILDTWKARVKSENLLHSQIIYGYFPCLAEGNSLYIYDPAVAMQTSDAETDDSSHERPDPIATFTFPRQKSMRRLCIADFFLPKDQAQSGQFDVFPMQAVTVGDIATKYAQKLFQADQYTDYLYYYGLSVQTAEALAEWCHARIRRELGYSDREPETIREVLQQRYQGSRYSFGYPACPNIPDQFVQLDLLQAKRIGMIMDASEQLVPEQSTTAIVTYHPAAKYFSA